MKKLILLIGVFLMLSTSGYAATLSSLAEAELFDVVVSVDGDYWNFDPYAGQDVPNEFVDTYGKASYENGVSKAEASGEYDLSYSFFSGQGDWFVATSDVTLNLSANYRIKAETQSQLGSEALAFSSVLLGYFRAEDIGDGWTEWTSGYEAVYIDGFESLYDPFTEEYFGSINYSVAYAPGMWGTWFYDVDALAWTGNEVTPVPEPMTLGLLGIGLCGVLARRKKHDIL